MHLLIPGYRHPGPVSSTGKGFHLLFEVSGARNGAAMRPGLDFRGQNGYIVAPPSIHPNGHAYKWARPYSLAIPPVPSWLADLLTPPAPPIITNRKLPAHVAAATNHLDLVAELTAIGVQLRQRGAYLVGRCPFHADDTPSLVVYPNETFFCFGCGYNPDRSLAGWGDALNVRHFAQHGTLR